MSKDRETKYPATSYERAAEALALAAEDLMYCEEFCPGEHLSILQETWEAFAREAGSVRRQRCSYPDDPGEAIGFEELEEPGAAEGDFTIRFEPSALEDSKTLGVRERADVLKSIHELVTNPSPPGSKPLKPIAEWPRRSGQ